ncbi:MAG: hypothetical protein RLZZ227_2044 [Pseudomonadota bacterium]|jgi:hypothetical protein
MAAFFLPLASAASQMLEQGMISDIKPGVLTLDRARFATIFVRAAPLN